MAGQKHDVDAGLAITASEDVVPVESGGVVNAADQI